MTLINHTGATWRVIFLKRNLLHVFSPGQQKTFHFTGYAEDWVEFDAYQSQGATWVEEASYKFSDYSSYTVYF